MRNKKTLSFFYILVLTCILISVSFLSTQSTTTISSDDVTTTDVFGTNATFTGLIKDGNLSLLAFDWDNLYNVPPLGGGGGNPFNQSLNTTDLVLFDTVNVSGIANIVAGQGLNAELNLWADEGDDSQDKWRIEADGSGLHFEDVYSSRYASIQYNTGVVINEGGDDDVDFRVESDTDTHALFVDAEYGNVSCGTFFVDAINDYVGIGTDVPAYELDVNGDVNISGVLYTDNVSNKYMFNEDYDANANKFEVISPNGNKIVHIGIDQLWNIAQLYTDANALELWAAGFKQLTISNTVADFDNNRIVTTGNVGIGTTTPSAPLDVEVPNGGVACFGNAGCAATGDYSIAAGSNSIASGRSSYSFGSNTAASGDYTFTVGINNAITGRYSAAIGNALRIPMGSRYSFAMGNNNDIGGSYSFTGGRNMNSSSGDGTFIWGHSAAVQGFAPANNRFLIFPKGDAGRVGIGTTAPDSELHVVGDSNITGSVSIGDVLHLSPQAAAPGAPVEGDIYYNSVNHKAYCYDGTIWQGLW